jgi:glycerol kinase
LRDNLGFFEDATESEALALSVPDTDGVIFVPAFTGLGAPYWNPNARASITGMSRGTTKAHITRAALEAQAFQTRDLLESMQKDVGADITNIRVDGGLANNDFVCQSIADQTNATIDRPSSTEATVWGVAAMAYLQSGVFKSLDDITAIYKLDRQFKASGNNAEVEESYTQWQKAVKSLN